MGRQPRKGTKAEDSPPTKAPDNLRQFQVKHLDEPAPAPEILIDGVHGVAIVGGVAKLRCFSARPTQDDPNSATLVLRLAMPAPTLQAIHTMLGTIVTQMVKDGVLPSSD